MLIISASLWNEIKNIIPEKKSKIGRPPKDPKTTLSGVFYIMITGAQWHQLPDYYGRPTTVHGRFRIWVKSGIFDQIWNRGIKFCWTQTKDSFLAFCQLASAIHNFKLVGIFGLALKKEIGLCINQ